MQQRATGNRKVYLAGPDGFTPVTLAWHDTVLVPAVVSAGLIPVSPWHRFDAEFEKAFTMPPGPHRQSLLADIDDRAGALNARLIEEAAGMLAQLDGPDVDSGTAAEVGYGSALGLFVSGVRSDLRTCADNEGVVVNLQVQHFISRTGGSVHRDVASAIAELAAHLL